VTQYLKTRIFRLNEIIQLIGGNLTRVPFDFEINQKLDFSILCGILINRKSMLYLGIT
jgi:hypothetical protein